MFTHVFDEMKRGFFDQDDVRLDDRLNAGHCYEMAVKSMTLIIHGFEVEYAHLELSDRQAVHRTRYELSRTMEMANKAVGYLESSEEWDEYFEPPDKLREQARNLWAVARALSRLPAVGEGDIE